MYQHIRCAHPDPLSIVSILGIDIGQSILFGLLIAAVGRARFYLAKKPASRYTYSDTAPIEVANHAMQSCGSIIFITAAGGSLARVIDTTGVGELLANYLAQSPLSTT